MYCLDSWMNENVWIIAATFIIYTSIKLYCGVFFVIILFFAQNRLLSSFYSLLIESVSSW